MTLAVNSHQRIYKKGVQISFDLCQLIISYLLQCGADSTQCKIPYGVLSLCAKRYHLTKPTVTLLWKKYCFHGTVEDIPPKNTPCRLWKLSEEDHLFVCQLMTLDPTIYKSEIREKLWQYSNTPFQSISISTISRTVCHRLGVLKWTRKHVQHSNRDRWAHGNILYTRNFMDHVGTLDVNSIRFVDECSFSVNSGIRYYGSSEVGSKALHVSKHDIGINYTLFLMVGLNNKIFAYVTEGPSDSHTYVEFIHQAVNSFDTNGLPVLYPGCCIVSDRAPIHGKHATDILYPYLEQNGIDYFYLPTYSPCLNPMENCFSYLKSLMKSSDFQELLRFYVPTAICNAIPYLTHDMILNFFKNVSCNYMNL